jgi:Protein of unknown function (DUF3592)
MHAGQKSSAPGPSPNRRSVYGVTGCVVLFFMVGWSFVTVTADFMLVRGAFGQVRTLGYETGEGQITECRVTEEASDDGTSYDVKTEYTYRVGDQRYTSTHVRHLSLWDHRSAARFAADHPPGSRVTVYHDPADPGEAVLVPGLGGPELFQLMFLTPFNVIMVGLAFGFGRAAVFGDPPASDWPRGVSFFERDNESRVRLVKTTPTAAGLVVLMGGTFFGTFVVAFGVGIPPSAGAMIVLWCAILGGAGYAYWKRSSRIAAGRDDLVINRSEGTLTLPQSFGRTDSVVVPLNDVLTPEVVVVETKDENGHLIRYAPTVRWRGADGEVRDGSLAEWADKGQADRLVEWITSRAG